MGSPEVVAAAVSFLLGVLTLGISRCTLSAMHHDEDDDTEAMETFRLAVSIRCITTHAMPLFDPEFRQWVTTHGIEDAFLLVALDDSLTRWRMHFMCNDGTFPRKYTGLTDSIEIRTTPARYEWTVPY